jgi:hypothetical protein
MCSLLLKKALPFALTFVLGSLIGGLFKSAGFGDYSFSHSRSYYYGYGEGHACRMRFQRRYLVAESKPLVILFKPDARRPHRPDLDYVDGHDIAPRSALVSVTFGADGKVQAVEPFYEYMPGINRLRLGPERQDYWDNVERAARMIQFTPETENGVPVTVTKELEIFFLPE